MNAIRRWKEGARGGNHGFPHVERVEYSCRLVDIVATLVP